MVGRVRALDLERDRLGRDDVLDRDGSVPDHRRGHGLARRDVFERQRAVADRGESHGVRRDRAAAGQVTPLGQVDRHVVVRVHAASQRQVRLGNAVQVEPDVVRALDAAGDRDLRQVGPTAAGPNLDVAVHGVGRADHERVVDVDRAVALQRERPVRRPVAHDHVEQDPRCDRAADGDAVLRVHLDVLPGHQVGVVPDGDRALGHVEVDVPRRRQTGVGPDDEVAGGTAAGVVGADGDTPCSIVDAREELRACTDGHGLVRLERDRARRLSRRHTRAHANVRVDRDRAGSRAHQQVAVHVDVRRLGDGAGSDRGQVPAGGHGPGEIDEAVVVVYQRRHPELRVIVAEQAVSVRAEVLEREVGLDPDAADTVAGGDVAAAGDIARGEDGDPEGLVLGCLGSRGCRAGAVQRVLAAAIDRAVDVDIDTADPDGRGRGVGGDHTRDGHVTGTVLRRARRPAEPLQIGVRG